jgi:hypothetical protein
MTKRIIIALLLAAGVTAVPTILAARTKGQPAVSNPAGISCRPKGAPCKNKDGNGNDEVCCSHHCVLQSNPKEGYFCDD